MTDRAALTDLVDRFVTQQMETDGTPGVALAVTDRDGILLSRVYGVADLAARQPVTAETLFEIGSIGKSFTAVLTLQLSDEGVLDLDQPVTRYLPWFDVHSRHEPITLHHLLSHTAGITSGLDTRPDGQAEVWALRETETGGPPGGRYHYSNVGYKVLGLALARALGQGYGDALRERILDPLAMTASTSTITHEVRERLAVGYISRFDDRPALPDHGLVPGAWIETDTGDGSIAATATDLAAFARLLLRRGEGPEGRLLSEEAFARLITPVAPAWDDDWSAYGLFVKEEEGRTTIGHPGGMIGYAASLQTDLEAEVGVVVLVNGPGEPHAIGRFVLDAARAAVAGTALPELPAPATTDAAGLAEYAGIYRCISERERPEVEIRMVDVVAPSLVLRQGEVEAPLTPYWGDFVVNHREWDRYVARFARDDAERVLDLVHGPDQYRRADALAEPYQPAPASRAAFAGHYRAHNPWAPNCRVVLRRGRLWLLWPESPDGFAEEDPLVPLGDDTFRVGDAPEGPERIRFTAIADGAALEAVISGGHYYRFFTP